MAYVGTASNTGNDIYTLASIIQGEAGNQGAQGMQAVGNVIANRAASNWGNNGSTLISQATAPNQFQGQAKPSALALQTAANLVNGNLPDITGGATSYANPGASSAKWAKGLNSQNSLKIGDHYFTDNQNGQPFVPTAQQDQSFYNNAKAAVAANIPPQQLTNLVQAYQSGAMPADARAQFEQDVHSGKITLPAGVYIGGQMAQPGQPQPVQLPASVATAYNMGATNPYQQGAMPDNARAQLDEDLAAGKVALPSGTVLNPHRMTMLENAEEAVTGNLRSTPETQAAKPYYQMPEENQGGIQGIKTALGSMLATNPNEIAQIIKANNPNLESKQDSKGNWLFKSNQDGQWYAIQPGFDLADAAKLGLAAAAFTPAGRASTIVGAAAANAGTQAALEGAKYAAGGNAPDPASIALAGGIGGAVPAAAKILPAVAGAAKKAVGFGVNAAKPEAEAAAEGPRAPRLKRVARLRRRRQRRRPRKPKPP